MADGKAPKHEMYLDCVRGYAIALVIAAHAVYLFPGIPYPVRRLATLGWSGVQLFFVASMVTLLMSWNAERKRTGTNDLAAFAIRRLARIAPMYYAGVLLYLVTSPPERFDLGTLLATLGFVNAWDIDWLTAPGAWGVVPGGWSISVEMSFYLLFPAYALLVRSLTGAIIALAITMAAGAAIDAVAAGWLMGSYPEGAYKTFLFYWLPNQASVFAIGGIVYFLLPKLPRHYDARQRAHWFAFAALLAFAATAYVPHPRYMGDGNGIPEAQLAAIPLACFLMAMSLEPRWFANLPAKLLGKVSFSAYVVHMALLRQIKAMPWLFDQRSTGVEAIIACIATFVVAIGLTAVISLLTWAAIERTGVAVGRKATRWLSRQRQTSAGAAGKRPDARRNPRPQPLAAAAKERV